MPHPAFHIYCKRIKSPQRKPAVFDCLQQVIKNWKWVRQGRIPFVSAQDSCPWTDTKKGPPRSFSQEGNEAGRVQHTCISWAAGFSSFLSLAGHLLGTVLMGKKVVRHYLIPRLCSKWQGSLGMRSQMLPYQCSPHRWLTHLDPGGFRVTAVIKPNTVPHLQPEETTNVWPIVSTLPT